MAALLIIFGILLLWRWPDPVVWHGLGEALVIAGVLTFVVDPFLKRRLLKEAAKGIFEHLIGFDQQPEIKERLKNIAFNTKLFRRNFQVNCRIHIAEDQKVRVEFNQVFELVNPTDRSEKYQHFVAFEKGEHAQVSELVFLPPEKKEDSPKGESMEKPEWKLDDKPDEPGVVEAKIDEVRIPPTKGESTYRFVAKYSITLPDEFYYIISFKHPTKAVTVCIDAVPEGWEVTATPPFIHAASNFHYPQLFMPGEAINIRWRRSSQPKSTK